MLDLSSRCGISGVKVFKSSKAILRLASNTAYVGQFVSDIQSRVHGVSYQSVVKVVHQRNTVVKVSLGVIRVVHQMK